MTGEHTRSDILSEGLALSDAEIAGFMAWRGPGAYTVQAMRRLKEVIAEAVARDRNIRSKLTTQYDNQDVRPVFVFHHNDPLLKHVPNGTIVLLQRKIPSADIRHHDNFTD